MNKIQEQLLTPSKYSRSQIKLKSVKGIVIHWVANPTSTAESNRNFFERRKEGRTGTGSAHYIVGLQGEVIQCLPENEMAYHVGSKTYLEDALTRLSSYPNNCTIGIEFCHPDATGKPNQTTYESLVELTAMLLKKYKLDESNLWTHQSIVGWKQCPLYYVKNVSEWEKFKHDVAIELKGGIEMKPEIANQIIKYLSSAHKLAKTDEEKENIHDLANELRKISGQEVK